MDDRSGQWRQLYRWQLELGGGVGISIRDGADGAGTGAARGDLFHRDGLDRGQPAGHRGGF